MPMPTWYTVNDPFMPGVIVGIKCFSFNGSSSDLTGYRAIEFPGDTTARATLFTEFCNILAGFPNLKRFVTAISLQGIPLTEQTMASLSSVLPLSHIDLRGHHLTASDIVALYHLTKGQCQIIIDQTSTLAPDQTFSLPAKSLGHIEFSRFLQFLHRIHIGNAGKFSNFCDSLSGIDISTSHVQLNVGIRSLFTKRSIFPKAMSSLTLNANQCSRYNLDWLSSLPKLRKITLSQCRLPQHAQLVNALKNHCHTLEVISTASTLADAMLQYNHIIQRHHGIHHSNTNFDRFQLTRVAKANLRQLVQKHSSTLISTEQLPDDDSNGASEYKQSSNPNPMPQTLSHQQKLVAFDFLALSQQHFSAKKRLSARPLPRTRKRVTLFSSSKYYRNLDHYQDYMKLPTRLLSECTTLLNINSNEQNKLQLQQLAAAVAILSDPYFNASGRTALQIIQVGTSPSQASTLQKKLSDELSHVELARAHYRSKQSSYPMQSHQLETIARGINTALSLVESLVHRLKTSDTATAQLEAADFDERISSQARSTPRSTECIRH